MDHGDCLYLVQLPSCPTLGLRRAVRATASSKESCCFAYDLSHRTASPLAGKVHWRNTLEQLNIVGPKSLGVCLLTSAFIGMVFTIQFIRWDCINEDQSLTEMLPCMPLL